MWTAFLALTLFGMLAFADASLAEETAWPCDDPRLPRIETFPRREVPTPRGTGIVERSVRCLAETANYKGPRGEGPATLITWTYSFWDLDYGASQHRLFLITPDGEWREIPGIVNPNARPAGPDGRKWQLPPRIAAYSAAGGLLGGLNPDVFYDRLLPVAVEEIDPGIFCFSQGLRYPFTGAVRGCSTEPAVSHVLYDKTVLSLGRAQAIAIEAYNARQVPSSANTLTMRLAHIVDGNEAGQFHYEFWVDRVQDVAITVDGLSGEVQVGSRQ